MNPIVAVLNYAKEIYFSSESSDSGDENVIEKIPNYVENIIPRIRDITFQQHFRMTKTTFKNLIEKAIVVNMQNNPSIRGFPKTCLQKELMITIWYLGNIESFRSVAERFDVSKSTCWDILQRTCNLLLKINASYRIIQWPNRERQIRIANNLSYRNNWMY